MNIHKITIPLVYRVSQFAFWRPEWTGSPARLARMFARLPRPERVLDVSCKPIFLVVEAWDETLRTGPVPLVRFDSEPMGAIRSTSAINLRFQPTISMSSSVMACSTISRNNWRGRL